MSIQIVTGCEAIKYKQNKAEVRLTKFFVSYIIITSIWYFRNIRGCKSEKENFNFFDGSVPLY